MDNKTVYVRTSKGEDEMQGRTMHLSDYVKRILMMVDGAATYGEISKRAAPSLRADLVPMLQELEKGGYITDKAKAANVAKASAPLKMATPRKIQSEQHDDAGDLDFMSGPSSAQPKAQAASKFEIEAAIRKAQQENEPLPIKAVQGAAKARDEEELEKQRIAAEIQAREDAARRAREEAEAARLRAEQALKARLEAEAKARQQIEEARKKAEREAAIAREAAERVARQEREAAEAREAARVREEAERRAREAARAREEVERQEREAAKAREAAMVREEAERREREAAKAREEAERHEREAAKAREEAAKAREEAENRAREAARAREEADRHERESARVLEEAEKGARETTEASEAAERQARLEALTKAFEAPPAAKHDTFAFDSFHVDVQLPVAGEHKAAQPVQRVSPAAAAPGSNLNVYAFDAFKIDVATPSAEPSAKEKASHFPEPGQQAIAAQPAEPRQPAQQEVPTSAANRSAGAVPDEEAIQREAQERIAVEKRLQEEKLAAKKQADAQAREQAEAEQRAAEIYKKELEQAANQTKYFIDNAEPVAQPAPVARTVRRKPFTVSKLVWFMFKLGMFLFLLLVAALFATPHFVPTRDYIPKVESYLSGKLQQPVHIGRLSGRILPLLRVELGEVSIGKQKQFQADQVQLNFAVAGLFVDAKPIDSIEFQGVKVSGAGLQGASAWMQQLAVDNQYPVARMEIRQGTLDAVAFQLAGIEGTLNFNPIGEFVKGSLRSNGGKYLLDINAAMGSKLQVEIKVRDSALPLLPNWTFDELTAKGVLSSNDLSISEFEGQILDGVLQGNASIDWHSGWLAQGTMAAKKISMQRLNRLLEGNIDGSARFKMSAVDLAGLADTAVLEGSFSSKNGMIGGVDIVTTTRAQSREHMPGGRTRFDELSGDVAYANNTLRFNQTKITTSVLNAVAMVDINKQRLAGSMIARLSLQEPTKPAKLQIAGEIDSPTLQFVP